MVPKNVHMKIGVGAEESTEEMKKAGHRGREKGRRRGCRSQENSALRARKASQDLAAGRGWVVSEVPGEALVCQGMGGEGV